MLLKRATTIYLSSILKFQLSSIFLRKRAQRQCQQLTKVNTRLKYNFSSLPSNKDIDKAFKSYEVHGWGQQFSNQLSQIFQKLNSLQKSDPQYMQYTVLKIMEFYIEKAKQNINRTDSQLLQILFYSVGTFLAAGSQQQGLKLLYQIYGIFEENPSLKVSQKDIYQAMLLDLRKIQDKSKK